MLVLNSQRAARTDSTGYFTTSFVPPGVYTLRVRCVGFRWAEKTNMQVNARDTTTVVFTMQELPTKLVSWALYGSAYSLGERSSTAATRWWLLAPRCNVGTMIGQRLSREEPLRTWRSITQPLGLAALGRDDRECGSPDHAAGRYALFAESSVITGNGTLAGRPFAPRVFSPTGAFASREVGINVTRGRPSPVTVQVYSCSGRLEREAAAGPAMNAEVNLVRWDGRDRKVAGTSTSEVPPSSIS